jgi:hypothetical protein
MPCTWGYVRTNSMWHKEKIYQKAFTLIYIDLHRLVSFLILKKRDLGDC